MNALTSLAQRFKEPSSWAGLAGIVGILGIHADPGMLQSVAYIGAGVCGLVAFLVPEKKS